MTDAEAHPNLLSSDAGWWDREVDVIVVGFGGAGACAALEAKEHGADVLILDRFGGGGATALSGGVYYGAGTRHQKEAGFDDDAEQMFNYLKLELGDVVSEPTLRRFCDESAANLAWLESHGVPFGSAFSPAKTSYPGNGVFLYFSGNEIAPRSKAVAKPAPRGHRAVGKGGTGKVVWKHLHDAVERRGIPVREHTPVTRLVIDAEGRVVGVECNPLSGDVLARHRRLWVKARRRLGLAGARQVRKFADELAAIERESSGRQRIRARHGVILATGGFTYNREWVDSYAPLYADGLPLTSPGCDGSGIALGGAAGGDTAHMQHMCASRSIAPPAALLEGIVVDRHGRRFVNEDAYTATLGRKIAESEKGVAWLIIDAPTRWQAIRQSLPGKGKLLLIHCLPSLRNIFFGSKKAKTIADLARKCGISADALERSVETYNAASGQADALAKKSDYVRPIVHAPFYALDISAHSATAPLATFTLGGLTVDEESGEVRRKDGSNVAGLYAVGRTAVGLPSNYYLSGLSISDCVFSGRRAGNHAAMHDAYGRLTSSPLEHPA
jgi:3-oxo-5alpha-steroid 4-dehydrogenase